VPAAQRARSNREIADDLRERLEGTIPGMEIRTRAPQGQFLLERLLGGGGGEGFNLEVRGFELGTLDLLATRAMEAIEGIPGVTDVAPLRRGRPAAGDPIDREKVADLGLSAAGRDRGVRDRGGGIAPRASSARGDSYRILVQLADATALSIDEVLDLTLAHPLRRARLPAQPRRGPGTGPPAIERKDQQRSCASPPMSPAATSARSRRGPGNASTPSPARRATSSWIAGKFRGAEKAFGELMISHGARPPARLHGPRLPVRVPARPARGDALGVPMAAIGVVSCSCSRTRR
jgi:hydrophobic/amphiphilic exporter-1 (mainly G- bacteria), HAE1 family